MSASSLRTRLAPRSVLSALPALLLTLGLGACDRGPAPAAPAPAELRPAPPLTPDQLTMLELPRSAAEGTAAAGTAAAGTAAAGTAAAGTPIPSGGVGPHGSADPGSAPADALGGPRINPGAPALAGLRWRAEAPLESRPPSQPMRSGEYFVRGEAGEAVMAVFHFPGLGGTVDDNVDRWVGQFVGADGEPAEAEVERREVAGLRVTRVEVEGEYRAQMGAPAGPQAGQAMLGAIIEGPEGPVFFKMIGPAPTVASAEEAFDQLIESLTLSSQNG